MTDPTTRRRRPRMLAGYAAGAAALVGLVTQVPNAPADVRLALNGSAVAAPSTGAAAQADHRRGAAKDVVANLFEWNWPSVAKECTTVLGPAGYGAVQVSPPQDSVKRQALGDGSATVLHPWWEVYQPVDYHLTSRMGTPDQFRAMVASCRKAGVQVIVDTVINHMTGQGTVSYGGVRYTKYRYQGLYSPSDFHSSPADCPVAPDAGSGSQNGSIADFNDVTQVFHCELVGLSDLRTETAKVRNRLAAYLNTLLSYGVSGFRVDAAKHIGQVDLAAIESRLHRTVDGTRPYIALEVSTGSPGRISPWAFQRVGNLLGFDYATQIHDAFKSYNSPPNDGNIADLRVFGTDSGLLPSTKELVFVQNHDTERNGSTLNYKDDSNTIATEFMLAWPHGRPQVYSGFAWATPDDSPPSDANGLITDTNCDTTAWVCVDRDNGVRNMVGWRNTVGAAPVANWWDDGTNAIAFSRGNRGWIAVNNEKTPVTHRFTTGLPRGLYCDVIHGQVNRGVCFGPTVRVDGRGHATVTVPPKDAVAISIAGRV